MVEPAPPASLGLPVSLPNKSLSAKEEKMETPPTIRIGGLKSEHCATVFLTTAPQGVEAKERIVPAGSGQAAYIWVLGARC
jgi:hypothetical protein